MALGILWQILGIGSIWMMQDNRHVNHTSILWVMLHDSPTSNWLLNSICLLGNSLYLTSLTFLGVSVMVSLFFLSWSLAKSITAPSSQGASLLASSVLFSRLPHKDPPKTQNLLTVSNVLSLATEQLFPRPFDGLEIYLSGLLLLTGICPSDIWALASSSIKEDNNSTDLTRLLWVQWDKVNKSFR